jgi:hypothetical protein
VTRNVLEFFIENTKIELEKLKRGEPSPIYPSIKECQKDLDEMTSALAKFNSGEVIECSTLDDLNKTFAEYGNDKAYHIVFSDMEDYIKAHTLYSNNLSVRYSYKPKE